MSRESTLRKIIGDLGEFTEEPHFQKTSFRTNKKIFATFDASLNLLVVKLNLIDQSVFSSANKGVITPVPNKWGTQGWTQMILDQVIDEVLGDVLKTAYNEVAKK